MRAGVSTMLALMFGGGVSLLAGSAQSVPARAAAMRQVAHAMPRAAGSTSVGSVADCTIFSGSPTSSAQCGAGNDDTVGTDGNGAFYRTMVSFTNLSIPAGSTGSRARGTRSRWPTAPC